MRLCGLRSDLDPAIAALHSRIVKRIGDGSMIESRSVVNAVRCAIAVQTRMVERNAGLAPERMKFRTVHVAASPPSQDEILFGPPVCPAAEHRRGSDDRREGSE